MTTRILIVGDDERLRDLLAIELNALGFQIEGRARTTQSIAEWPVDSQLALFDMRSAQRSAVDVCRELLAHRPELPLVLLTSPESQESAVQAVRVGAYDFITAPFAANSLDIKLRRALEHCTLQEQVRQLRRAKSISRDFSGIVGASEPMQRLFERLERVASSHASVLVRGESGTGKELVARALHELSPRAAQPFVTLSCAAIPESLLESELFGVERGASPEAKQSRIGAFRQAHGGTLLLEEVGELSSHLQAKLLRALEERVVRPLGGERDIPFDTRVIAATHQDLEEAVASGRFRSDLFFRLNVVAVTVPPLRQRGDDVLLLASHFLIELARRDGKTITHISAEAADRLRAHGWYGNVRELRHCIEHAVAMSRGDAIAAQDLPEHLGTAEPMASGPRDQGKQTFPSLFDVERHHVLRVLHAVRGNKSLASRILGIDRKTLHARLSRYQRASQAEEHVSESAEAS